MTLKSFIRLFIGHYFDLIPTHDKIQIEETLLDYVRSLPKSVQFLFLFASALNIISVELCERGSEKCKGSCINSKLPTIPVYTLMIGIMSWKLMEIRNEG